MKGKVPKSDLIEKDPSSDTFMKSNTNQEKMGHVMVDSIFLSVKAINI